MEKKKVLLFSALAAVAAAVYAGTKSKKQKKEKGPSPEDCNRRLAECYRNPDMLPAFLSDHINVPRKDFAGNGTGVLFVGSNLGEAKDQFLSQNMTPDPAWNYVIADPFGDLQDQYGNRFLRDGYKIYTLNLGDFEQDEQHHTDFSSFMQEKAVLFVTCRGLVQDGLYEMAMDLALKFQGMAPAGKHVQLICDNVDTFVFNPVYSDRKFSERIADLTSSGVSVIICCDQLTGDYEACMLTMRKFSAIVLAETEDQETLRVMVSYLNLYHDEDRNIWWRKLLLLLSDRCMVVTRFTVPVLDSI